MDLKVCPFGNKNKMYIRKIQHGSRIVWIGSWLNYSGQPIGDKFQSLKLAKNKAVEMNIPFEIAQRAWVSV